ncbi:hypothetical protein QWY31_14405 [Cytophagales bacterium LB-30]|uniref:Uncharacterized protein n=1 Tax=Shiella aurantiaca TaxID=3058365 RepID=A0ABT8F8J5_9BACT|nr:hypothetical protein [Shiella aurantiaca]MDN4166699.1 hypothetical protein [Shiella aurantiaca]
MTVNIDTALAIVGLLVTIFLGYLGLKYTLKYRKKTEIIFLKNASISLFKTIVKNLDDIEINFQGKKISENLILFKGTFFNNGNIDIEKTIIHKPLDIELPTNYSWVRHKIIDTSDGLEVKSALNNNKLIFEWDLLKEGEFFTFDSLVEYKTEKEDNDTSDIGKKLLKNIKINHRITDLKNVSKENSIPRPMPAGGLIIISLLLLGMVAGGFYVSFGQLLFPKYEVFTEANLQTGKQFVTLSAENENMVSLLNQSGDKIQTFTKDELSTKLGATIQINKSKVNYWIMSILGFFSITYFIAWIGIIISQIREKRLYSKLKKVADKYDDLDIEDGRQVDFTLFGFILR